MKTAIGETDTERLRREKILHPWRHALLDRVESADSEQFYPAAFDRVNRNPFSISFVQPGAIPFFFEPEYLHELELRIPHKYKEYFYQSVAMKREARTGIGLLYLADQLEVHGYRAQVVGPHGGGKSTLMHDLAMVLCQLGHAVFYRSLHDRQRNFPHSFYEQLNRWMSRPGPQGARIVFLDGYEKLSWLHRVSFRLFCQSRRLGLLVSTHSPVFGTPVLYRTRTSAQTLQVILEYLLDETDFVLDDLRVANLYERYRGDIREILFNLYDEYERWRIFD